MKQYLVHYWLAMNASGINSASHAVKTWLAVAAAHTVADSIPELNLCQLASVFGVWFVIGVFEYQDKHPLSFPEPPAGSLPQPANPTNPKI